MLVKDILLAPIYFYQASKVKKTAIALPEAQGERHGRITLTPPLATKTPDSNLQNKVGNMGELGKTDNISLNMMLIGDSSAAGVGVDWQQQGLIGQLLAELTKITQSPVSATFNKMPSYDQIDWSLHASTGHTSFDVLRRLYVLPAPEQVLEVMVFVVGVNDVTRNLSPRVWQNQLIAIITLAKRKFAAKHIVFSSLPPMRAMPSLPYPLNAYIGAKAQKLDAILQAVCQSEPQVTYLPLDFKQMPVKKSTLFASDGFHPSATAYHYWAQQLAALIASLVELDR